MVNVCVSCGKSGHKTNRSKACPNFVPKGKKSPDGDFCPQVAEKEIIKEEKAEAFAQQDPVLSPELSALEKAKKDLADMMAKAEQMAKSIQEEEALLLEKANQEAIAQWEKDNSAYWKSYNQEAVKFIEENTGIVFSHQEKYDPENPDMENYQDGPCGEFRGAYEMYKIWKKASPPIHPNSKKQPRKKSSGKAKSTGGGVRCHKVGSKAQDKCQARLFYKCGPDWVVPDFCGRDCVGDTNLCKIHTKKLKEGLMGDGKVPDLPQEQIDLLTNHPDWGPANRKEFGM